MVTISKSGRQELVDQLQKAYPHRKNLSINSLEEINEGWETKIISFSLNYKEKGLAQSEGLIMRSFQGTSGRAQAMKEFEVMEKLASAGIPVPKVEVLVRDSSAFRNPYVVMEKIAGPTMNAVLQSGSDNEIHELTSLMVSHFVQLHQIPWQKIFDQESQTVLKMSDPLSFVKIQLSELRAIKDQFNLAEFTPFLDWLETRIGQGASDHRSVIHNDYHPLNILIRDDGSLAIIDWSFADVGDYRLDLAWSVLLFGVMLGTHYRNNFVSLYEEIAGAKVENLQFFEVLKFTQRMLTIASWLDESVNIPVKKITRPAIRNEYKVHVLNPYRRLKEITGLELPIIESL